MAVCHRLVWRKDCSKHAQEERYVLRACSKRVEGFYHVSYSEPLGRRREENPVEDVVGLCLHHLKEADAQGIQWWSMQLRHPKAAAWTGTCCVFLAQRGLVGAAVRCHPVAAPGKVRITDQLRAQFKRIMKQKNMRELTIEDWKSVFDASLEEFIVESVMDS